MYHCFAAQKEYPGIWCSNNLHEICRDVATNICLIFSIPLIPHQYKCVHRHYFCFLFEYIVAFYNCLSMNCGCLAKISFFDSVSYGEICNKTQLIPPVCLLDFFVCLNLNRFTKQGNYNVSLLRLFSLVIKISLFVAFNSPFFCFRIEQIVFNMYCIVGLVRFDSMERHKKSRNSRIYYD